jgi:hypothetical protein
MRESAVSEFVKMADADWSLVHQWITQSKLIETECEGPKFYLRNPVLISVVLNLERLIRCLIKFGGSKPTAPGWTMVAAQ